MLWPCNRCLFALRWQLPDGRRVRICAEHARELRAAERGWEPL